MAYRYALALTLVVAALSGSASDPARAQCRLCDTPTTERVEDGIGPIRLEVETTLDFDRLVLMGGGDGSATLLPSGERSSSGSIVTVSARAMVGTVMIRGEPGRSLRIDLPQRIQLHSLGGSTIVIDRIETDLSALPKLDSNGALSFQFGGRLQVSGNADGEYRGDLPITVEYL